MESNINSQIIYELNNDICDENSLKEEKDYENDFQNESYFTPQSEIPETQLNKPINNNLQMNSNSLNQQLNIINIFDFWKKGNNISSEEDKNTKEDRNYIGRKKIREEIDDSAPMKDKSLYLKIFEQRFNDMVLNNDEFSFKKHGKLIKAHLMEENDDLNLEEPKNEIIDNEFLNLNDFSKRISKFNDKSNININKHLIEQKSFLNYDKKSKLHQNKLDKCNNKDSKFLGSLYHYNNNNYLKVSFNEKKDNMNLKNSTGKNDFSYILNFNDKNIYKCNQYSNCLMDMDI